MQNVSSTKRLPSGLAMLFTRGVRHFSKGLWDFEITVISLKSVISIVISIVILWFHLWFHDFRISTIVLYSLFLTLWIHLEGQFWSEVNWCSFDKCVLSVSYKWLCNKCEISLFASLHVFACTEILCGILQVLHSKVLIFNSISVCDFVISTVILMKRKRFQKCRTPCFCLNFP